MPDKACATLPVIGEMLEQYRIIDELGAGGMGVVYRAHDQRLNRDVAIKVLRPDLIGDAHGMDRFHREARTLAALNHPNIASIYQFVECGPTGALAMELVEGPTLADRIANGCTPLAEAVSIALQISAAIECAHEHGIIHRDLKPGNIKLTADGVVKVLDFGLATFLDSGGAGPAEIANLTTAISSKPGCLLGTPAYMSPEQACGATVDRRADIWAFGVVLYEMLAGRCAFHRATTSDCIAAVIKDDPDWSALPANVPAPLLRLLRHCLAKDPHERLHAIADARLDIEEISDALAPTVTQTASLRPSILRQPLPKALFLLVLLLAAAAIALVFWQSRHREPPFRASERFSIVLPNDAPLAPPSAMPLAVGRSSLALSPDGSHLVYVAFVNRSTVLYVRDMHRGEFRALAGTEGAHSPFFSPDGQSIGFFAHDKLKKVSLNGDPPVTLCDATLGFGGTWAPDGQIYFSTDYSSGINQVSESGGVPASVTGDTWMLTPSWFPQILPDERSILFSTQAFGLGVYDLRSRHGSMFLSGGTSPRYTPTGYIMFARRGTVQVAPFSEQQLRLTGSPVQLFDAVRTERDGAAQFTFSGNGTFVYASGGDGTVGSLVMIDRHGNRHPLQAPPGDYSAFQGSRDGTRVAIPINTLAGTDIWIYDTVRGSTTRLTSDGRSSFPVWSADGTAIYYMGFPGGVSNLYRKATQGGPAIQLTHWRGSGGPPLMVTPDGKNLLVGRFNPETREDLWLLQLAEDGRVVKEAPFLTSRFSECLGDISPNSRWLAYTSDESGGWEVYVTSFPHPGEKIRISTDGGEEPLWAPNGRELFYRFGTKWFVVNISDGEHFAAGQPQLLFEGPFVNPPGYSYNVMPNGTQFLVVEGVDQTKTSSELIVVTNVFDEIRRRVSQPGR